MAAVVRHHQSPLVLGRAPALRAIERDHAAARTLRAHRFTRIELTPIDAGLELVDLYAGSTLVSQFALHADGTVQATVDAVAQRVPYGNWLAYELPLVGGLALVFALMSGVAPLRRMRNLDVAVMIGLAGPMLLLQQRQIADSTLAGAAALIYLAVRCGWRSLGPPRPQPQSRALFDVLAARLPEPSRRRILTLLLGLVAVVFIIVATTSPDPVDVVYAVMEGAGKLLHGVLPYGHLSGDVVHGDTYPLLGYFLYTPLALLAPVDSVWSSVDLPLAATAVAALLAALGVRHILARVGARRAVTSLTGLRTALSLLTFPPLLAIVSTGTSDVVLAALLVLALALWRRPAAAAFALACGGWFKLAPFALLPILLAPLRRRELAAASAAVALVSVLGLIGILALGGLSGIDRMISAIGYQFSRGSYQSVWHALGIESLQPIGLAAAAAVVAGGTVKLARERPLTGDPVQVAGVCACVLIALQLAANYWAFLYLAWLAPLLVIALLSDPESFGAPVAVDP